MSLPASSSVSTSYTSYTSTPPVAVSSLYSSPPVPTQAVVPLKAKAQVSMAQVEVPMEQASRQLGFPNFVLQRMLSRIKQGEQEGLPSGAQPITASVGLSDYWHVPSTHVSLSEMSQLSSAVKYLKQGGQLHELSTNDFRRLAQPHEVPPTHSTKAAPVESPKVRSLAALVAAGQAWHVPTFPPPQARKKTVPTKPAPSSSINYPPLRHGLSTRPFQRLNIEKAVWQQAQSEQAHPFYLANL